MSSMIFFLIFIPILSCILLVFNFLLAPHNPYKEKKTPFECGYHSFLSQNRTQFTISFFIFGLLFLIFDLEIVLIYPYSVSSYANNVYGLIAMLVFTLIVTIGFIFELGKNALKIESKQTDNFKYKVNYKIYHSKDLLQKSPLKPLQSSLNVKYIMVTLAAVCIVAKYKLIYGFMLSLFNYHILIYPLSGIMLIIVNIIRDSLMEKAWSFRFKDYRISFAILILLALLDYNGYLTTIRSQLVGLYTIFFTFYWKYYDIFTLKALGELYTQDDLKAFSFSDKVLHVMKNILGNLEAKKVTINGADDLLVPQKTPKKVPVGTSFSVNQGENASAEAIDSASLSSAGIGSSSSNTSNTNRPNPVRRIHPLSMGELLNPVGDNETSSSSRQFASSYVGGSVGNGRDIAATGSGQTIAPTQPPAPAQPIVPVQPINPASPTSGIPFPVYDPQGTNQPYLRHIADKLDYGKKYENRSALTLNSLSESAHNMLSGYLFHHDRDKYEEVYGASPNFKSRRLPYYNLNINKPLLDGLRNSN